MIGKRNILITGATGGIGRAIAHALSAVDTTLLIVGRDRESIDTCSKELIDQGALVIPYVTELEDKISLDELSAKVRTDIPHLDWIIHAAGYIDENEPKQQVPYDVLERTFRINTLAPLYLTESLKDILSPEGGVINISSTASHWGNPDFPIYAASKGALNTYTQALGKQFDTSKKLAITICPGGTNTAMRERVAHDRATQQSPDVIADCIKDIIEQRSAFKNKDVVIIRDGVITKHAPI